MERQVLLICKMGDIIACLYADGSHLRERHRGGAGGQAAFLRRRESGVKGSGPDRSTWVPGDGGQVCRLRGRRLEEVGQEWVEDVL